MTEAMIPILVVFFVMTVLGLALWLRYRVRSDIQTTIRAALDKGHELSPELIDRLGHPKPAKDKDLRAGIIWLAVAVGLIAFGFGIPDEDEATQVFMGMSAFPAAMGFAFLILHKLADKN